MFTNQVYIHISVCPIRVRSLVCFDFSALSWYVFCMHRKSEKHRLTNQNIINMPATLRLLRRLVSLHDFTKHQHKLGKINGLGRIRVKHAQNFFDFLLRQFLAEGLHQGGQFWSTQSLQIQQYEMGWKGDDSGGRCAKCCG